MNSKPKYSPVKVKQLTIGLVIGILFVVVIVIADQTMQVTQVRDSSEVTNSIDEHRDSNHLVDEPKTLSDSDTKKDSLELKDIFAIKSRFEQFATLFKLLASADQQSVQNLLNNSKTVEYHSFLHDIQSLILQRLTIHDPLTALKEANKFSGTQRNKLIRSVFQEWSLVNFEEAVSVASTLDERGKTAAVEGIVGTRDDLSRETLLEVARELDSEDTAIDLFVAASARQEITDPDTAWSSFLTEYGNNFDDMSTAQLQFFKSIAHSLLEQYGTDAIFKVSQMLEGDETATSILLDFLDLIALEDPELSFELAISLSHENDRYIGGVRVMGWTETDPLAALDALVALEDYPDTELLVMGFNLSVPAERYARQILDRIRTYSQKIDSELIGNAVYALTQSSPESAATHLDLIEDDVRRLELSANIARSWARRDIQGALDWVQRSVESANHQRTLQEIVLVEFTYQDSSQALQTALDLPLNESGIGIEESVIETIAEFDLSTAVSMLPKSRNTETKTQVGILLGNALIKNGQPEAAFNLVNRLPEAAKAKFIESITRTWALVDPNGMYANLEQLPSTEYTAQAAGSLLLQGRWSNNVAFTQEEQIRLRSFMSDEDLTDLEEALDKADAIRSVLP